MRTEQLCGPENRRRTRLGSRSHPEDTLPAKSSPSSHCPAPPLPEGSRLVRASPTHSLSLVHTQPRASQARAGAGEPQAQGRVQTPAAGLVWVEPEDRRIGPDPPIHPDRPHRGRPSPGTHQIPS